MSGRTAQGGGTARSGATEPLPLPLHGPDCAWNVLYAVGAVAALVSVAGSLVDIVLTMMPGWGPESVPATVPLWFAQLATDPLLGLRNLDLLNITMSLVTIPLYVALLGAHRRTQPALALLAVTVVAVGTTIFVANSAALPMLELSRGYVRAGATGGQAALEGAAQALLARGAHGSLGALPGFFLSSAGTLLMAVAMVRGGVFGRVTGWIGVVGAAALSVYTVGIALAPGSAVLIMAVAMPGGLLMMAWSIMVARRLLRLRRDAAGAR